MHQFSPEEFAITLKTFASVFEYTQLWYGLIGLSVPVVGIIGSEKPIVIDGLRMSEIYDDRNLRSALSQIALDDKYMFLSHFVADVCDVSLPDNTRINTDDKPILEFLNPKMELNTPLHQRGDENMQFMLYLKMNAPQSEHYINVDEPAMSDANREILRFIYNVFTRSFVF
jgi:hypothetical protein